MSSTGTWRKMLNLQGVSFIHRLQSTHFKQSSFLRICYFVTTIQLLLGHHFCKKSVLEDHTWQSLNKQQFWSWKRSTAIPTLEYSLHISAGLIRDTDHQLSKGILYCILQKQESDHKCAWFWSPSAHGNTFQTIASVLIYLIPCYTLILHEQLLLKLLLLEMFSSFSWHFRTRWCGAFSIRISK